MKQHDLEPAFAATLYNGTDELTRVPVDLTTATAVVFILKRKGTIIINRRAMTVVSPTAGTVSMPWVSGDTANTGAHQAEIEVTWPGTRPQTFPANGTITIFIEPDLG
jgi:hypothetical protein